MKAPGSALLSRLFPSRVDVHLSPGHVDLRQGDRSERLEPILFLSPGSSPTILAVGELDPLPDPSEAVRVELFAPALPASVTVSRQEMLERLFQFSYHELTGRGAFASLLLQPEVHLFGVSSIADPRGALAREILDASKAAGALRTVLRS